jgi:hypothetical protein
MKKIYLLSLLCLIGFSSFAQSTATIYATGGPGSYITATTDGTTRTEDNIVTGNVPPPPTQGYAVFDLSGIPAGATIDQVIIGFYVTTYGGAGTPSVWNTYGYPGDLSGVTVPATLLADMTTFSTSLSTATYGTSTGNQTLPSTAAITNFVAANIGGKITVSFTGGGTRTYTMKGESGVSTSTVAINHAPYIQVTYCEKPTAVVPTAAPNPICTGKSLVLNTTAVGSGTLTYSWSGPGGYTAAIKNPTELGIGLANAGVYTVTVTNTCAGVFTATTVATTASVTVNPSPAAITSATGIFAVCDLGTTALSDATASGNWSSASTTIATVSGTGLVTGVAVGATNISYILPVTGCYVIQPMTVNAAPAAIMPGLSPICQGNSVTETETTVTGVWSSSNTNIAVITASIPTSATFMGVTTGGGGVVTISYTVPGCPPATTPLIVNPTPQPITTNTGAFDVCIGFSSPTTMSDALGGGTWTASNTDASFGFGGPFPKNNLYGSVAGIDTVTYTITATGCFITATVNVQVGPPAITGPSFVCEGSTISLSDTEPGGGGWTSNFPGIASVVGGTGLVTGNASGVARITFTPFSTTCYAVQKVTVNPQPAAITYAGSPAFCQNDSLLLGETDPGGKWSSSNTVATVMDTSSGWLKGIGPGGGGATSTTVSYTFRTTGCATTLMLTEFPYPDAFVSHPGPLVFCSGGSVTLSVPAVGGTTYQWYNGGALIAGASTSNYTTSTTQSLSVDVVNTFGCIANSIPVQVISGISPTIDSSGSARFCLGSDVILTAGNNGAVGIITYQWQFNGLNIASAVAAKYPATKTGNYACIVTVSGGLSGSCSGSTTVVAVTAAPLPSPVITYTRTPSGTTFSTGTGYKTYQWYINSVAIPGAVAYSYTASTNGSYRVRVTDTTDCGGYSVAYIINDVAVPQISLADVKIFPNPATSVVHIESPVAVRAIITGVEGKILIDQANANEINISSLANGMYIIMLYDENGERLKVEKLVKQ